MVRRISSKLFSVRTVLDYGSGFTCLPRKLAYPFPGETSITVVDESMIDTTAAGVTTYSLRTRDH